MELQKRKRENDGGANAKRGKAGEDGNCVKGPAVPADEEVEEFYAILKRIQVAVKYFRDREGGRQLTPTPSSSLKFEKEDFVGAKKEPGSSLGFDLNSAPVASDSSDHAT